MDGSQSSGVTPPENLDYYKQGSRSKDAAASSRHSCIFVGILLELVGGALWLSGHSSNSSSYGTEVAGFVIAWIGAMLLFVGLVAVGVRLGTEELLQAARQYVDRDRS
jgi:hypothetical protein